MTNILVYFGCSIVMDCHSDDLEISFKQIVIPTKGEISPFLAKDSSLQKWSLS